MSDVLLLAVALLACTLGMAWFALAKEPHWRQLGRGRPFTPALMWRLRMQGSVALVVAFTLCLAVDHVSMAVLVWVMAVAAAALLVTFTLSWRPAWLVPLTCGPG